MNAKKHLLFAVMLFAIIVVRGQTNTIITEYVTDTARVNHLLNETKKHWASDSAQALILSRQAIALAKKIGYAKGEGLGLKNIGVVYYFKSHWVEAIDYWDQSLKIFQREKDQIEAANVLSNIGAVYAIKGDDAKALEFHYQALKIAESTGDKPTLLKALNNIGGVYWEKKVTWNEAREYLLRAFPISQEIGNKNSLGLIAANLGDFYYENNRLDSAEYYYRYALSVYEESDANSPFAYNGLGKVAMKNKNFDEALSLHRKALRIAEQLNEKQMVESYQGLANTYLAMGQPKAAFDNFRQAEQLSKKLENYTALREILEQTAEAYASVKNYQLAFDYRKKHDEVKDSLYNENTRKKVGLFEMELNLEKKQTEVDLLAKDQALKDSEIKKQRLAKNAFTVGFILVFIIAFIIFRNYRQGIKINRILDKQKDQIEHLLLNILPSEVAKELQVSGHATPRNYESVSVLFTDFKGFTTIADKMSPEELVNELNECFMAFDEIIGKHSLEKIKTIGDSYMCAGGIPSPDPNHAINIVKAGLEIQEYIRQNNLKRKELGLVPWEARVGIHSGPIVAGVVGKKKYAYDIWGSTVNIASRMESNGEAGKVNISAATYDLIREKYNCKYRGKIYAKNVGEVDMYFIEEEITPATEKPTFTAIPAEQKNVAPPELVPGG